MLLGLLLLHSLPSTSAPHHGLGLCYNLQVTSFIFFFCFLAFLMSSLSLPILHGSTEAENPKEEDDVENAPAVCVCL
uniref:Putative secreted peptide n=1 Tax=Anopheles braziliensis TaxID=58242 RepID=A0A2M3ZPT5_9DIPT